MALWERLKSPPQQDGEADARFGRALEGLVGRLQRLPHPSLLDLGFTCGANIDFFVRLGCRVHVDDYTATLMSRPAAAPVEEKKASRPEPRKAGAKKKASRPRLPPVEHETGGFQAVLCWDIFDYLSQEETVLMAREVRRVTAPGGFLLGIFGPSRTGETRPPLRFRIKEAGRVQAEKVEGPLLRPHHLANRDINKLFPDFEIAQTVLLRNGSREMLLQKRAKRERRLGDPYVMALV
jgi:hypothetical protein